MGIDTTIWDTDLVNMIADMPETMTFGAQSVSVMIGDADKSHELSLDGYDEEIPLTVEARVESFTSNTPPDVGGKVTIASVERRVIRQTISPDGKLVVLQLERTSQ